jgi:hypothetical protein
MTQSTRPSFDEVYAMFPNPTPEAERAMMPRFSYEGFPMVTVNGDKATLLYTGTEGGKMFTRFVSLVRAALIGLDDEVVRHYWDLDAESNISVDEPKHKGNTTTAADGKGSSYVGHMNKALPLKPSQRGLAAITPDKVEWDSARVMIKAGNTVKLNGQVASVDAVESIKGPDLLGFNRQVGVKLTLSTGLVIEIEHG